MAPFSPPNPLLADRASDPEASCADTLQIYQAWTIVLGSCLGVVLLGSTFFIVHFLKLWRQASAKYTALKQQHDFVVSQASYYASRIDRLQALLDRATNRASPQTPQGPVPLESADPADMQMDPFAVGVDSSSDDEDDFEAPIVNTARAQPITPAPRARKTSVFTDGTSPRTLLLTPGSSYVSLAGKSVPRGHTEAVEMRDFVTPLRESGRATRRDLTAAGAEGRSAGRVLRVANPDVGVGPSSSRESFECVPKSTMADKEGRQDEVVEPVDVEDEDETFGTFSGVHARSPGPMDGSAEDGEAPGRQPNYQTSVEDAPRFPLD